MKGIEYDTFQDDFDLGAANHFSPVADAITKRYPHVTVQCREFTTGKEKLALVEDCLSRKEITIVSLANTADGRGGWHIMPIVDADETRLYLFNYMDADGNIDVTPIDKTEFVKRHDEWERGKEIAFLLEQTEAAQSTR